VFLKGVEFEPNIYKTNILLGLIVKFLKQRKMWKIKKEVKKYRLVWWSNGKTKPIYWT